VIATVLTNPAAPVAGSTFFMTINGSGFCAASAVRFNGTNVITSFVTVTQLSATVSGSLTTGLTGNFPVDVVNPVGAGCPSIGTSNSVNVTLVAPPPPVIVTTALPDGVTGVLYNQQIQVSGGDPPFTFSSAGSLPSGVTLNPITGILNGVPTAPGLFNFSITVRDNLGPGRTSTVNYAVTIRDPLTITTTFLPSATVSMNYTQALGAQGGTPPYTWSIVTGGPPGIVLSPAGILSGAPTQTGLFNAQFRVTDSVGNQATQVIPLTVVAPLLQITTTALPVATAGVGYNFALAATGGAPPLTWSTTSALPLGLSLSSGGVISGTTQQTGTFPLAITARDSANQNAQANLSLTVISPLEITTLSAPPGFVSVPYNTTVSATGGAPPYTWSAPSGLPPGISLDAQSGILSGTPSQEGTFGFDIQVRDVSNRVAMRAFVLVVGNALSITNATLKKGLVGTPYQEVFVASGGTPPYRWAVVGAAVPGLTLDAATGVLSGTPLLIGNFNITVRVADAANLQFTRSYSITVDPVFQITTDTLPAATLGVLYERTFTATGGTPPYFWSFSGSALPGLALQPGTGILNGVPTQSGTFAFNVIATDSQGQQASKGFTLNVNQAVRIAPDTLPGTTVGANYSQTFSATGGVTPYVWSMTGLVPGLTLDPVAGTLRGIPTQPGTFPFSIRATDALGQPGTRDYSIGVIAPLQILTDSLPEVQAGFSYSQTLAATGGAPPYTWRIINGSLPEGLSLNAATGLVSGSPARAGSATFSIEVADGAGARASRAFTITVSQGLTMQPVTLPSGTVGIAYSATFSASGGAPPYRFRVAAALLPDGLQMDAAAGRVSGTPARAGRFVFTIEVADSGNRTASAEFTIVINASLLRITSADRLPDATAGADFQFTAVATGGTPPYRWSLSGAPAGLEIAPDSGVIRGRPMTPGPSQFTVRVTDNAQIVASMTLTLNVVLPATPSLSFAGLPATGTAATQVTPSLRLDRAYPLPIAGELALTFASEVGVDDPAIQFASGGRRVAFQIAPGSTDAALTTATAGIQLGTLAGTITVTARLTAAGTDITPTPAPSSVIRIPRQAPVITSMRVNRTANGFELILIAYSTAREITSASVRLQTSGTVQGTEFTVNLAPAVGAWYQGAASLPFGSQCTITLPFTIQGTTGTVTSASVTLSNSVGASQAASANF
jgi:hypothetical protein